MPRQTIVALEAGVMSILSRIYKHTFGRVLSPSTAARNNETVSKKRKRESVEDKEMVTRRRQREDSEENNGIITKRRRVDEDRFAPIVNGQTYESTPISGIHHASEHPQSTNSEADRMLMPPPALSPVKNRYLQASIREHNRRTSLDLESVSQLSYGTRGTQQRVADDLMNEYDMEKARRHAAATSLPANSGVWERGEKEIFFHLSYRGFEPIFPHNWMTDFRTMPLSLFSRDDEDAPQPLIRVHKENGEFRAIRELRELLDLGKNVRDKVLSSPGIKRETIIEKATKKYINWALSDAGVKPLSSTKPKKGPLPTHVIVKLKIGQTTTECLIEMKDKMHAIRTQHYRARNIHESIESAAANYSTPELEDETQIADSSEDDLPVIYGIMIYKSILAIFTLNSRTPSPRHYGSKALSRSRNQMSNTATENIYGNAIESVSSTGTKHRVEKSDGSFSTEHGLELDNDTASDPRFISDFDFSDPAKDVWNALVIAILAMQIRKDMILANEHKGRSDALEDIRAGIEENSIVDMDEDDPDA